MAVAPGTLYRDLRVKSPNHVLIAGSFTTAGGSAPSVTTGAGFTVGAPTAGGVYTVTLTGGYTAVTACVASLEQAAGGSGRCVVNSTAAGSVDIETQSSAGTGAQLTGPIVHFVVLVRMGSVVR